MDWQTLNVEYKIMDSKDEFKEIKIYLPKGVDSFVRRATLCADSGNNGFNALPDKDEFIHIIEKCIIEQEKLEHRTKLELKLPDVWADCFKLTEQELLQTLREWIALESFDAPKYGKAAKLAIAVSWIAAKLGGFSFYKKELEEYKDYLYQIASAKEWNFLLVRPSENWQEAILKEENRFLLDENVLDALNAIKKVAAVSLPVEQWLKDLYVNWDNFDDYVRNEEIVEYANSLIHDLDAKVRRAALSENGSKKDSLERDLSENDQPFNFNRKFIKSPERKKYHLDVNKFCKGLVDWLQKMPPSELMDMNQGYRQFAGSLANGALSYKNLYEQIKALFTEDFGQDEFMVYPRKFAAQFIGIYLAEQNFTEEELSYLYTVSLEYQNDSWYYDHIGSGDDLLDERCHYLQSRKAVMYVISYRIADRLFRDLCEDYFRGYEEPLFSLPDDEEED